MSDYKYWLDISSANQADIDHSMELLKAKEIVPNILALDHYAKTPVNGEFYASFDTESIGFFGTAKGWDREEHEQFFNELSRKFPSATFELRGVCVDDPQNNMFCKAFHNGQYKEVWQDNSDLSERLSAIPWRSYGTPELSAEQSNNFKTVISLTCIHETKFGATCYTSLHPTREAALAHVDDVKVECDFEENNADEYFNWDIDEHILDVSELANAKAPEVEKNQLVAVNYQGFQLDVPSDYDHIRNLDLLHHLEDFAQTLASIPWSAHKAAFPQAYADAADVLSIMDMLNKVFSSGVTGWVEDRRVDKVKEGESENAVYLSDKASMHRMMENLIKFAQNALPLNNGRDNDDLAELAAAFHNLSCNYNTGGGGGEHAVVRTTGASEFENAVRKSGDYLSVVCQVYSQFLYKKLEHDLGYPSILPTKSLLDSLKTGTPFEIPRPAFEDTLASAQARASEQSKDSDAPGSRKDIRNI